MRKCSKCGYVGDAFYGKQSWCKKCKAAQVAAWQRANPDKARAYRAKWEARKLADDPGYRARMSKSWRAANPERAKENNRRANRRRIMDPIYRLKSRVWGKARYRAVGTAKATEYSRRWRDENREHYLAINRAHNAVRRALRTGRLVRPEECQRCGGRPGLDWIGRPMIHAHHADHARVLDVEWLCTLCHTGADGKRKRLA